MAKLSGQEVYPGDCVYDLCWGPGTVTAVEACEFYVSFGCGRPRRYNEQGMTGKKCFDRTLYFSKPIITELPKDECNAVKIRLAFDAFSQIATDLTGLCPCPEPTEYHECPQTEATCCNGKYTPPSK